MPMRYSELEKQLREIKCKIVRQGTNHTIWYSPITGKIFPVSRHKTEEVPTGTLKSIKKDAGL
jgi:predicted RNA binding protein YcfA (HicA-like mRNA interferase family)